MLSGLMKALSAGGREVEGVGKEARKKKKKYDSFMGSLTGNGRSNGSLGERRRKERERRQSIEY